MRLFRFALGACLLLGLANPSGAVTTGSKVYKACVVDHKYKANLIGTFSSNKSSSDICVHLGSCVMADMKIFLDKNSDTEIFVSQNKYSCR